MKTIKRDWAALAREGKHRAGEDVYVGFGNGNENTLDEFFGYGGIRVDGSDNYGFYGADEDEEYFVKVEDWEKATGLNYEKTINSFNTDRDWAALAKENQNFPDVVYVGKGDKDKPLRGIFGPRLRSDNSQGRLCHDVGFEGSVRIYDYFIDISKWEEVTGLNYRETIMESKETKENPGSSPVNTSKNWAELASFTREKRCGTDNVYIGFGDAANPLSVIFGGQRNISSLLHPIDYGYTGDTHDIEYVAKISAWEEATGLKFHEIKQNTQINTMSKVKVIRTKQTPALLALAIELTKDKIDYPFGTYTSSYEFLYVFEDGSSCGSSTDSGFSGTNFETVSVGEFIAALEKLPEKKKKAEVSLGQVKVQITPEKLVAGCQEYTLEEVAKIAEKVEEFQKAKTVRFTGRKTITIDKNGIHADGLTVTFAEFDKVKAAVETVK